MKGYVHVYTGDGKGKTTAALGLCLRAVGAGLKVYIGQFLKHGEVSEHRGLELLGELITVGQYGNPGFLFGKPRREDIEKAELGLAHLKKVIDSGNYDVVIMDEVNVAVHYGLIKISDLLEIVRGKPDDIELVLTGRNAAPELVEAADLVTEMRMAKHYFDNGVVARMGIEK